jgi:hypothetical protein
MVKVTFTLEQAMKAERGRRGITTISLASALDGGGWLTPRPDRFTLGKATRYPSYRRLGGPPGRCGRVRKTSLSPGSIPGPSNP